MRYATKEGTFRYLKRFKDHGREFYRYDGERFVSSLGLGTFRKEPYREENYTLSYKEAVKNGAFRGHKPYRHRDKLPLPNERAGDRGGAK